MVDKELEKIRAENKKISEQWEKEIKEKARRIAYFLGAVKTLQARLESDADMILTIDEPAVLYPSNDEIQQISVFLAKSIHPNPLNKPFPIK